MTCSRLGITPGERPPARAARRELRRQGRQLRAVGSTRALRDQRRPRGNAGSCPGSREPAASVQDHFSSQPPRGGAASRARPNCGSGAAVPSTHDASISPSAGPILNPWPEPPPAIQTFAAAGWRSTMKCESGTPRTGTPPSRAAVRRRARESAGAGTRGPRRCRRRSLARPRRSDRMRGRRIVRDLETAVRVAGNAVEQPLAVIHPHRHRGIVEARVAGRRAEVVDLLPRRRHARADHIGEQPPEPRPAREHERVGLDLAAVDRARCAARDRRRSGRDRARQPAGTRRLPRRSVRRRARRRGARTDSPRSAPRGRT